MIELVYISRAAKRFKDEELVDMLATFRKNNAEASISGMLLYDGHGTFIQAIEGSAENIKTLYNKITHDTRHTSVVLLSEKTVSARKFASWQMGFSLIDQSVVSKLNGYSDFMISELPNVDNERRSSIAHELLFYFREKHNINK